MNNYDAATTETRFVRADRVCVGDIVKMEAWQGIPAKDVFVTAVRMVGDDVEIITWNDVEAFSTSVGNGVWVERTVEAAPRA